MVAHPHEGKLGGGVEVIVAPDPPDSNKVGVVVNDPGNSIGDLGELQKHILDEKDDHKDQDSMSCPMIQRVLPRQKKGVDRSQW